MEHYEIQSRPLGPVVIDIENITKDYVMGEETVHALRGVTLQIHRNEYLAIMGPSGSGKSTLMNMLGCLDTPTPAVTNSTARTLRRWTTTNWRRFAIGKSDSFFKHLICFRARPACAMSSCR